MAEKTYLIGMDLGNTRSRSFFTERDPESDDVAAPAAILFDKDSALQSTLLNTSASAGPLVLDSVKTLLRMPTPELMQVQIRRNPMAALERGSIDGLSVILESLASGIKRQLQIDALSSHKFSVRIPAHWLVADSAAQMLKAAAEAMLGPVELYHDAAAAVLGAAAMEVLPLHDGSQGWIVIDAGGFSTRFSLVYKDQGSLRPVVSETRMQNWGGDALDGCLKDLWFLPTFGSQLALGLRDCEDLLLLLMRDLRERLAKAGSSVEDSYRSLGLPDVVTLDKQTFANTCTEPSRLALRHLLQDSDVIPAAWDEAEAVLLVGAGAAWNILIDEVKARWASKRLIVPLQPDLLVAKGLALASSPMQLQPNLLGRQQEETSKERAKVQQDLPVLKGDEGSPVTAGPAVPFDPHAEIHKNVRYYALACAGVALALAWLPFAAWPILMAIEVYMLVQIAKHYGYRYDDGLSIGMVVGLLLLSLGLSAALAPVTETMLCFAKPVLAGLIAWGMGEGGIKILEFDRSRRR